MPKRLDTYYVETDEVQGEGSYVIFRRITVGDQDLVTSLPTRMASVNDAELRKKMEKDVLETACKYLVEWNWVDSDDNPLPQPHNNPDVIDQLTADEWAYCVGLLLGKNNATKKNVKSISKS